MPEPSCKFKPGDRVVYISWDHPSEGVGGTVIEVSISPHHSGVWSGPNFFLLVILDSAEEVLDEAALFWHEAQYDPQIPF